MPIGWSLREKSHRRGKLLSCHADEKSPAVWLQSPAEVTPTPTQEGCMPVETPSFFAQVIQDHLELKRRNAGLEPHMPLDRYRTEDPFDNHPLFKTEEQARLEETMDGEVQAPIETKTLKWPGEEPDEQLPELEGNLWSQS